MEILFLQHLIVVLQNPTQPANVLASYFGTKFVIRRRNGKLALVVTTLEAILPKANLIMAEIIIVFWILRVRLAFLAARLGLSNGIYLLPGSSISIVVALRSTHDQLAWQIDV